MGSALHNLLHLLELFDVRLRLVHRHVATSIGSIHDHWADALRIRMLVIELNLAARCWTYGYILGRFVEIRDK